MTYNKEKKSKILRCCITVHRYSSLNVKNKTPTIPHFSKKTGNEQGHILRTQDSENQAPNATDTTHQFFKSTN